MTDNEPSWGVLGEPDVAEVRALTARCLAAHGGLPIAAEPGFVARRYGPPHATALTVRVDGRLRAVAALRRADHTVTAAVLVDPAVDGVAGGEELRGGGLGGWLLDAALRRARDTGPDGAGLTVEVETEFLTAEAAEMFRSRGLRQVFAEEVMRLDLDAVGVPEIAMPDGVALLEWTADLAPRFHAVYAAAFADRPGFPGWSERQWVEWLVDDGFSPAASLLATDADGTDVGFVTSADGWLVQVGVPPAQRGRGLGAALVCAASRRQRAAGASEVLLDVAVGNPAGALYRRLGFAVLGRRGRYR